jgi:hypothetical protein
LSAGFLFLVFRQVDEKATLAVIKNVDKPLLFLAFLIYFFTYFFCFLRWKMLLEAVGIFIPAKRILTSFSGGIFFNLFLPSAIGGDFVRTLDLVNHTKKAKDIVATVFLDRLSGYVGLVILALLAFVYGFKFIRDPAIIIPIISVTVILVLILLVLFNSFIYSRVNNFLKSPRSGKIREGITSLHKELYLFKGRKKLILNNLFLSLLVQSLAPLSFYFVALSLGVKINILYFFIFIPVIGAITMLPISIGGLGLRDASTVFFFAKVGVIKDVAFSMSILSFSFILVYGILAGIFYIFTIKKSPN